MWDIGQVFEAIYVAAFIGVCSVFLIWLKMSGRGLSVCRVSSSSGRGGCSRGRGGCSSSGRGVSPARTIICASSREVRPETLITRPPHMTTKQGSAGVKMQLKSNYFALDQSPSWSLYRYRVTITPPADNFKMETELVKRAFKNSNCPLMDISGYGSLYSPKKLWNCTHSIPSPEDPNEVFSVKVENWGQVERDRDHDVYTAVYNHLIHKALSAMGLTEIGRHFYDTKKKLEIPTRKLTLIPGFITSIRNHEDQVLLCVDNTTKVVHQDTVLDLINKEKGRGDDWRQFAENLVVGSAVLISHSKKQYSIRSIEWDLTPKDTFPHTRTTLLEHYKTAYGLDIKDKSQPLLRAKLCKGYLHRWEDTEGDPESEVVLVPEFCNMTGLSDQKRISMRNEESDDAELVTERRIALLTNVEPQRKVDMLEEFIEKLVSNEKVKDVLREWSLGFRKELITVPGRVLPKQDVIFGKQELEQADWDNAFRTRQMYSVGQLKNWTVIVPQCESAGVDSLVHTMEKIGRQLGLPFPRPQEIIKVPVSADAYLQALEHLRGKQNDLVLVILAKPELYGAVKRNLTADQGLISQCLLAKDLKSKDLTEVLTKAIMQINAKLGGEPWALNWSVKDMMVVGVDVHRGTKMTAGKNVVAMTASVTDTFGRYFSTVSMYETTRELFCTVTRNLMKCLDAYFQSRSNGKLPSKILIYRVRVDESQLAWKHDDELEKVKFALKKHYKEKGREEPKLTFVVVNKKINTRLFTADSDEARNPPPGTVVDDFKSLCERYDFLLISQKVSQGVVTPSAYKVLWDTQSMTPDEIQLLTFKFCHMYFNWTATVAVPAPCQYAQKLAKLVAVDIGREPDQKLAYKLHFL